MRIKGHVGPWVVGGVVFVIALAVGGASVGASLSAERTSSSAPSETSAPVDSPSSHASVTPTPTPSASPAASPKPTASTPPSAGSALALLSTLPIKGRAPKTGYNRTDKFGEAWMDVEGNGCSTREDILFRDLTHITRSACKVLTGVLDDPYTGLTIDFTRGVTTSAKVQIDHVVALSDAWQTGAQQLSQSQREDLANDPVNLFAVDGKANEQKSDGDAATWLPPNKSFRCTYVAHQVSVKAAYALWVTQAEHDAIARILVTCPKQPAYTSPLHAKAVTPGGASTTKPKPVKPAPSKPAVVKPAPSKPAVAKPTVVHPGSYCSNAGAKGVTTAGTSMVCKTTATDSRLRWRRA